MRLYTGYGDDGSTDLLGERVRKDDPRIELIGTLDETTSAIGLARALAGDEALDALAVEAQRDLYRIMAELAFTDELRPASYAFGADRVEWIGTTTDALTDRLVLPRQFIVPGDTPGGAAFDVARATARRAERHAVALSGGGHLRNGEILRYLNRLSSLLFALARAADAVSGRSPIKAKTGSRA